MSNTYHRYKLDGTQAKMVIVAALKASNYKLAKYVADEIEPTDDHEQVRIFDLYEFGDAALSIIRSVSPPLAHSARLNAFIEELEDGDVSAES